jgi:peptidoglycan/LPS O-acetylase OafA/YrhL
MYHYLFFTIVIDWCINQLGIGKGLFNELLICFIVLGASIGVAALSFYLIERPILRFKTRFVDKKV